MKSSVAQLNEKSVGATLTIRFRASVCEVGISGKISDCQPEGSKFKPWRGRKIAGVVDCHLLPYKGSQA